MVPRLFEPLRFDCTTNMSNPFTIEFLIWTPPGFNLEAPILASRRVSQKLKTEWQTMNILMRQLITAISSVAIRFAKTSDLTYWAESVDSNYIRQNAMHIRLCSVVWVLISNLWVISNSGGGGGSGVRKLIVFCGCTDGNASSPYSRFFCCFLRESLMKPNGPKIASLTQSSVYSLLTRVISFRIYLFEL